MVIKKAIVLATMAGFFTIWNHVDSIGVKNVFDQMIVEEYSVLEKAEHIIVGGYDALQLKYPVAENPKLQIGLIYSENYGRLYIYGDVDMPEGKDNQTYQEYFAECIAKEGITWDELEDYKEDFICGDILEPWFEQNVGTFSRDSLGELEVVDYLMPYEYCGVEGSKPDKEIIVEEMGYQGMFVNKVKYSKWQIRDTYQCEYQSWDYNYKDILERIEDDINGLNSVNANFVITNDSGKVKTLDNLIDEIEFTEWLINSGKAKGNLTKLSYRREEGEMKTQEMLKNYPPLMLKRIILGGEYYFDNEYLYLRIPYYDYEAEQPGWLKNGDGEVWLGWLIISLEDMEEFF